MGTFFDDFPLCNDSTTPAIERHSRPAYRRAQAAIHAKTAPKLSAVLGLVELAFGSDVVSFVAEGSSAVCDTALDDLVLPLPAPCAMTLLRMSRP